MVFAIIVAGGSGQRMGSETPKQFLDLEGKPVLYYSIRTFLDAIPGIRIVVVLPESQLFRAGEILEIFPEQNQIQIVSGGKTRFDSVAEGLKVVTSPSLVLVHDGARPLVTQDLIRRCYENTLERGNAIPVVPVSDSIREISGAESHAISREHLRSVQTPQGFDTEMLKSAFLQVYDPAFTDEASVVEAKGHKVHLIEGEKSNIKITNPEDLIIAAALLHHRNRI